MRKQRPFLALWTLAVIATVAAFVLHLSLRGRTVDLGYKLGRARAEQARLREQKRVLSLEAASYETPQRVEMVARTLLGMNPPPPERVIPLKAMASLLPPEEGDGEGDVEQPAPKASASVPASPEGTVPAPVPAPVDGPAPSLLPGVATPSLAGAVPPPTDVPAVLEPSPGGSP